jgi:hypothetical protein
VQEIFRILQEATAGRTLGSIRKLEASQSKHFVFVNKPGIGKGLQPKTK